jgi:hypothetical protein
MPFCNGSPDSMIPSTTATACNAERRREVENPAGGDHPHRAHWHQSLRLPNYPFEVRSSEDSLL